LNRRVEVEQQIGEKTLTLVWLLFVQWVDPHKYWLS